MLTERSKSMRTVHYKDYTGKRVHFIGIGGISMSGLAAFLVDQGFTVTGSDILEGYTLKHLREIGITVWLGHEPQHVHGADLVVYSAAITTMKENSELDEAIRLGLPTMSRAALLGQIMSSFPKSIGVAGTHGKTTTTALLSVILLQAGLDPTVFLGGKSAELGGNMRIGRGEYCVVEACEFSGSFLEMYPDVGIVLNIDDDHLDYFKDMEHVYGCFLDFAGKINPNGMLIGCGDDARTRRLMEEADRPTLSFTIEGDGDINATDIAYDNLGNPSFSVNCRGEDMGRFKVPIPGRHNIYDALAAIAAASYYGVSTAGIQAGFDRFSGTGRRFELKGKIGGVTVIDDYGHHPSEIAATLRAATRYPHERLWCLFQPYTFSRTRLLFDEFLTCFDDADCIGITDIMGGREQDTGEIHSLELVSALNARRNNCTYLPTFEKATDYLVEHLQPGDLVITTGCGNIYLAAEMLVEKLTLAYARG
jgi:UDP-N-acetylmuramate--alanine ligase